MSKHKRKYMRAELTQTAPAGPHEWQCALCRGVGYRPNDVKHTENCVLADASVTSLVFIKSRAGVVFVFHQNRWWWTSVVSGKEYHIEKMPDRYQMSDQPGNTIVVRHRLSDIRHWIAMNQGVL